MSLKELKLLQSNIIKKKKKINMLGTIIISIIIVMSILFNLIIESNLVISTIFLFIEFVFLIIIFIGIKILILNSDIKIFNKEFKNIFVVNSLKKYFDNIDYNFERGFSANYVSSIGVLDMGDRFTSNDYVFGTYKNIKFEQSDIHIQEIEEETDEDGDKIEKWKTIFRGRLMIFDFNKNFKSNMIIFAGFLNMNISFFNEKFARIKLEDIDFNKCFKVYAENEVEAFYILTPTMMEKLKAVKEKLNCDIIFGFKNNKLHVALNNNTDSFEYNAFKEINEQEIEDLILNDIKVITNFVDELNLDNNLFITNNE